MDNNVIPLQLSHFVRSPFLGNLMMLPSFHVAGIVLFCHILQNIGWSMSVARVGSVLNNSAGNWSFPGDLLFLSALIALYISSFRGVSMLMSKTSTSSAISAEPLQNAHSIFYLAHFQMLLVFLACLLLACFCFAFFHIISL